MRITGGQARGIPLQSPGGLQTRPAMDRNREAVFSSLGTLVEGAVVLDLFAGTGAYGLEAISRGAREAVWVETHREAVLVLQKNRKAVAKAMGGEVTGQVYRQNALAWQGADPGSFDLIFADPPYEKYPEVADSLFARADFFLSRGVHSRLVLELPGSLEIGAPDWELLRRFGKKGRSTIALFARRPKSEKAP